LHVACWFQLHADRALNKLKEASTSTNSAYGADYELSVTPDQRHDCWSHWLDERAQIWPPERIRYPEMRL
jgi:hypothetical protein